MKFYFGPMSKNIVDTIVDFSITHNDLEIVFIPSRRQIEHNGGYVNNWTTQEFVEYVKNKNKNIKIERDHGGPSQGIILDDGYESLKVDSQHMDIIHIDPWKFVNNIDDGIEWTINMINYCNNINPNLEYEIATEETIYPLSMDELEYIINNLQEKMEKSIFSKIKYLVIQCGTKLSTNENIGVFDEDNLKKMIILANKYNLTAKEHNGDWVNMDIIKQKEEIGLTCINIAPELGEIETKVILEHIKNNKEDYEKIYKLCIDSGKWKKWVNADFDYVNEKDKIILITCHYIYSDPEFKKIKNKYIDIDTEIKESIKNKLLELYGYYSIRKQCIFCDSKSFDTLFKTDYKSSLSLAMIEIPKYTDFMPYNVLICNDCNSAQTKYLANINILYDINHLDNYGTTKNRKHNLFGEFITTNVDIKGIIEVGACHHELSSIILNKINTDYNIIEPSFTGCKTNLNIIPSYLENVDLQLINANTIIMSDVFEHFYKPKDILKKLQQSNIKYVYLNHPDFDYAVKNNILMNLMCEHTFLIEHQFLFKLFEKYGFILNRRFDFENLSLFLEFKRIENFSDEINNSYIINYSMRNDLAIFFNKIINNVNYINSLLETDNKTKFYIWPSAFYSISLITMGLNYKKLSGILDNSPNKIGKYVYGYNLLCYSFNEIIKSNNENICIILSCNSNYMNELNFDNSNIKIIKL